MPNTSVGTEVFHQHDSFSTDAIDQSHRYGRPQAACHEPAGIYDNTTLTAIYFEHKTQYLLIPSKTEDVF